MNKWLKRILITIASILVLLVVAVVALPFVVDPSAFRAPLERLAERQGVVLRLEGPIDWQFYPQLGLSLEGFYLAPEQQPEQPIAQAESATAAVALMPLFSGEVLVDQLVLNSPAINLLVDEQGRANWELLQRGTQEPGPAQPEPQQTGEGLRLAVERIAINDGVLSYRDLQSGQTAEVRELSVQLADVNLEERTFPMVMAGLVQSSELPSPLRLRLDSQLRTNSALTEFALESGELSVSAEGQENAQIEAQLSGQAVIEPALEYQGQLAISPFSPRAFLVAFGQDLPAMADPEALTALAVKLQITGSDTQVRSEDLAITLDETNLTGSFGLELPEGGTPKINLALQGDAIVLDRYLPPTEEESGAEVAEAPASPAPATAEAETAPEPLPLETLRSINVDATLSMDQIIAMEMEVDNPRIAITADNGLWRMTDLQGKFYQGQIKGDAQLDAREGEAASVQVGLRLDSMAVQPLLADLAEFSDLSGTVTGELKAQTRAATTTELMDNLSAAFVFTSPGLVFQGVNAEYYYCQAATQLDDDSTMPQREWPPRTEITQVEGQFLFDDSRLVIDSFAAYIENLVLTATGFLDLEKMIYRVRVPMRLAQQQTSAAGCLIESNFLQNRAVDVLGCSGSLAELEFGEQCGLDKDALADLAKQAVRYNVEKEVEEKKEDIREKLKERVQEELGEDEDDPARQLLRDLFNR